MSTDTAALRPLFERRAADRPIYLFMTLLFLATAVTGFAPRSAAILTGEMPIPPVAVHVHAAMMLSWLLLLVAQASLAASGRIALHRTLGTISYVLAPALFVALVAVTIVAYGTLTKVGQGVLASNILVLQMRSILLFPTFYLWAIAVRTSAPETHKRAMLVATLVLVDAAIARMPWLPGTNLTSTYDGVHLWLLVLLLPALVSDVVRYGRVHRVYVVGLALLLPWIVATHFIWNNPRWHAFAASLMGYGS
jgi:hypothetical protein